MPRHKKNDAFDTLSEVFALVPWWMPFVLAVIAWFTVPRLGPALVGGRASAPTWRVIAPFVAFLLLITGISAQLMKRRRRKLLAQTKSLQDLQALTWREFEELCAEVYRRKGYAVDETARGADGGVDLVLQKARERVFVQCKHYAQRRVGVRPIRELFGVMSAEGATAGIFVSLGSYTSAATQFARGKKLQLVDGPHLLKLLQPVDSGRSAGTRGLA